MYTPEKRSTRSFASGINPTGPDMDFEGLKEISRNHLALQQQKYKETNDFYDLQREEMESLSKVLEGTVGTDNNYLNQMVLDARNEYKEVLKGLKLKDYNTPQVQDKLFEIRNRLSRAKNVSNTSLEHIKQAYALSKGDHMKEGEITQELLKQLSTPPDQRDPDILNKIQTDPLYFNGYDYLTAVLDARQTTTEPIQRKDDNFFYSYDATYRPELGYFDKSGEWVFDPKDEVIGEALNNKHFYNTVLGLMPPGKVKELTDSGNKTELKKAVKAKAKEYMNEVFVREEAGKRVGTYDPKLVQKGRTLNPAKYQRPTAGDKKDQAFQDEVAAIQQRLLADNPQAFEEYQSPDGWQGFSFEYNGDGKISKIIGTMVDKDNMLYGKIPNPPLRTEEIEVDPDDVGSVQQALSRIKFVYSKDKKSVTAKPLQKQEENSKPKIKGF